MCQGEGADISGHGSAAERQGSGDS